MKKLISLIMAVLCIFSFVACGESSDGLGEIKPSGEKVTYSEVESFVSSRQESYLEKDMAKYEERKEQWFEVYLLYEEKALEEKSKKEDDVTIEFKGKLGFTEDRKPLLKAEFSLKEKEVDGERTINNEEEIKIVYIDDVIYLDLKATYDRADGSEHKEEYKVMGKLEDIYQSDITEALEILLEEESDWDYYGVAVLDLLTAVEELGAEYNGANYYKDGDKLFAEVLMEEKESDYKMKGALQAMVEFEKDSAIVNSFSVYAMSYNKSEVVYGDDTEIYDNVDEIKLRINLKQIEAASVKAPNTEDYQQI